MAEARFFVRTDRIRRRFMNKNVIFQIGVSRGVEPIERDRGSKKSRAHSRGTQTRDCIARLRILCRFH